MSGSENENTDIDDSKSSISNKFNIKKMKDIKEMQPNLVHEYIEGLHEKIKKQDKKLKKYKEKINNLIKQIDGLKSNSPKELTTKNSHINAVASVATDEAKTNKSDESTETKSNKSDESKEAKSNEEVNGEISATDAFSFVDEMRQAAQEAQNISNFVYEPTSGLYYDQKSGYYYNAEYGLYYDGNTGCYYKYNQEKNCYEFHSQVQVQPTAQTTKEDDIDDDDDADDVLFDEFGVVTDREKLKRLRDKKEQQKLEKDRKYKKKSSKDKEIKRKKKLSKHKRKRSKRHRKSSDAESDNDDDDDDDDAYESKRKSRKDIEDGELSTSSSSDSNSASNSESEDDKRKVPIFKSAGRFQDIAKKYPPSLRLVVQETNLDDIKVGSLSLITYKGGTLGREGNHDVIIPDVNVSKFHLKFDYDTKKSLYKCIDLGSRNGTILNGVRMSVSKTESVSYTIVHGSILQIAQTKLLCHIHEGNSTCGLCEPGLLIETQQREAPAATFMALSHKEQLKKLQRKYGLENEKFVDSKQNPGGAASSSSAGNSGGDGGGGGGSSAASGNYQDRAASRRLKIGSSTDKEKTQIASVDTAISSDNKGFRMLSKLGWNKGETLGKTSASGGLLEPINVESNTGHKGLGCDDPTAGLVMTVAEKKKLELMKKTKERYQKADMFSISDD